MKKWATALMIVTLVFSLMACGGESMENGEEVSANATISENSEVEESEAEEAEETTEETAETEETESLSADSVSENGETVSADSITEDSTDLDQEDSVTAESTVATNENETNNTENNSGNGDGATGSAEAAPGNVNNSANAESTTNDGASDSAESSANTTGPVPLGYGDDLTYSGSITLPSGLTIRTLNQFNYAGMNTVAGNSWMGDIYSDIVAQNYETMADNFDAFNAMYSGSAINVTNGEQIWWRSSMANMTPSLELRKCGDYYMIIISSPCLDDATAEAMGWMSGREAEAREALTVLLSTISSTPQELQYAILQTTYDAAEDEPLLIDANGAWTRIGDCQISVDYYNFIGDNHFIDFCIKP